MDDLTNFDMPQGFIIEKRFFTDPNFIERFNHQMKIFRTTIFYKTEDQESIKGSINAFSAACFSQINDESTVIHMHLEIFRTLSYYGEIFRSTATFENIIRMIESPEWKAKFFKKNSLHSFMVYGEVLVKYYGVLNQNNEGWFKTDNFEIIKKAKFYILKAYNQKVEKKNTMTEEEFSYCLTLLSACYIHLSRWFEATFYLTLLNERENDDINYNYLMAMTLNAWKDKSCLNLESQLLFRIYECSEKAFNLPHNDEQVKAHVKKIHTEVKAQIETAGESISVLKEHHERISKSKGKLNQYFKYCREHMLFLNEHASFCSCRRSIGDTLEIRTQHSHTNLDWVKKFEKLLDSMISDFSIARHNLYQSDENSKPSAVYKNSSNRNNVVTLIKSAYLKEAFKICYSLLDQICYGIFEAKEIDIEGFLKNKNPEDGRVRLYFLNMWDLYEFTEGDFKNNLYLISLYSLAKDLDRDDYSALKSFRDVRNAMEHKLLFVEEELNGKTEFKTGIVISKTELLVKTKILLTITKSAIVSFAYLIRRESKRKELEQKAVVV